MVDGPTPTPRSNRDRIDELEERIAALEAEETTPERSASGAFDRYDAQVLDELEPGETYTLTQLQSKYRSAGVRQPKVLKRRIKVLTRDVCTRVGTQVWQFDGPQN